MSTTLQKLGLDTAQNKASEVSQKLQLQNGSLGKSNNAQMMIPDSKKLIFKQEGLLKMIDSMK